jgi:hypothetical protein
MPPVHFHENHTHICQGAVSSQRGSVRMNPDKAPRRAEPSTLHEAVTTQQTSNHVLHSANQRADRTSSTAAQALLSQSITVTPSFSSYS